MKILFCGDAPQADTGFGTVAKNLLLRWHNMGHEISALGVNWFGDPYDVKEIPYKVWPTDKGSLDLLYGYQKFWWVERQVKPDLIFFLNDPWVIEKYLSFYTPDPTRHVKMVAYYPTDAGPMQPAWIDMLNKMDAQICYSNFAERVAIESNGGVRPKNLSQIYHGVDTKTFHPVNQSQARSALNLPQDIFIVGMVARNQYRKRFDLLAKGFADFAKDKDDVKLYIHTSLKDVGFDILDMLRQLKLDDKLILTEGVTPSQGVPIETLNVIYNCFDVNALISLGDGFGLPVAESMATGCPQLVSDHSCLSELVDGHGGLTVKNAAWLMNTGGFNTWGGVSDVKDITTKLNILYSNRELRLQLAQQASDYIHQPMFTWDYAAAQFDQIFRKIFHIMERKGQNGISTYTRPVRLPSPISV